MKKLANFALLALLSTAAVFGSSPRAEASGLVCHGWQGGVGGGIHYYGCHNDEGHHWLYWYARDGSSGRYTWDD